MMKQRMWEKGGCVRQSMSCVRSRCQEAEGKMIACQMAVELYAWRRSGFVDGIADRVVAASFLLIVLRSGVNPFVR